MKCFQQTDPRTLQIDIVNKTYEKAIPLSKVGGGNLANDRLATKFWQKDGRIFYIISLMEPNFVVIDDDFTPEDRAKVEQAINQVDRMSSYADYKQNLEQALSAALIA